jgi:hypothetical protein
LKKKYRKAHIFKWGNRYKDAIKKNLVSVSFFKTLVSDLRNSKILDIKYRETITNQYKKKENEKGKEENPNDRKP